METERPHRSNSISSSNNTSGTNSELFICFTSRLSSSSSSMKIPSKSILSPGRAREPSQISLSNSLSRRLRSNGSMKGGQASPMFPAGGGGKKRGCGFENPEPSSPKVTCIGQVRVKTKKKQGKKMRAGSRRRGEVSFRRADVSNNGVSGGDPSLDCNKSLNQQQDCVPQRNNQRWVHLPVTICEALRGFGAEFNCFLPCRSSCMAGEKEKKTEGVGSNNSSSSCGAVFARWLVAVQEGDGKAREIELVVGDGDEEEEVTERRRSYRRHVFDEIEFQEEKGNIVEDEARVSICIPPKNALLLMRCRSDPVKMAALSNKYWEPPAPNDEDEGEVDVCENEGEHVAEMKRDVEVEEAAERQEKEEEEVEKHKENLVSPKYLSCEAIEDQQQVQGTDPSMVILDGENGGDNQESITEIIDSLVEPECLLKQEEEEEKEPQDIPVIGSLHEEETIDTENSTNQENEIQTLEENEESEEASPNAGAENEEQEPDPEGFTENFEDSQENPMSEQPEQESEVVAQELQDPEPESDELEEIGTSDEEKAAAAEEEAETVTLERPGSDEPNEQDCQTGFESKERGSQPLLPDCLLLMMCEPKLSMEVSKETWVCSTDFIRWLPEHSKPPINRKDGRDEPKKRISIDINAPPPVHNNLPQPPRSSCSYPAKPPPRAGGAESMASAIGQKLVGSKACEPFVLTRCKSEPMRSAAKLAADACCWKNRKVEPHGPATLGIGAAGIGF